MTNPNNGFSSDNPFANGGGFNPSQAPNNNANQTDPWSAGFDNGNAQQDAGQGNAQNQNGGFDNNQQNQNGGFDNNQQGPNGGFDGGQQNQNGGFDGGQQNQNGGFGDNQQNQNGGFGGGQNAGFGGNQQNQNGGFNGGQNGGFGGDQQNQNGGFNGGQNGGFNGGQNGGFNGGQNGGFGGSQQNQGNQGQNNSRQNQSFSMNVDIDNAASNMFQGGINADRGDIRKENGATLLIVPVRIDYNIVSKKFNNEFTRAVFNYLVLDGPNAGTVYYNSMNANAFIWRDIENAGQRGVPIVGKVVNRPTEKSAQGAWMIDTVNDENVWRDAIAKGKQMGLI